MCRQRKGGGGKAHPQVLLLQVVHHGVHSRRQHGPVVLIVGIGLVYSTLCFAAHTLHVLLVLLLDVLHPNVVYPVKQSNLQCMEHFGLSTAEGAWQASGVLLDGWTVPQTEMTDRTLHCA